MKRENRGFSSQKVLGLGETVEETDQLMSDGILFIQEVLFKCEKEVGSINYSGIEKISGISGKEKRKDLLVVKRRSRGGLQ